jgi:glutaminyl-peptide cyclotransferase
MGIRAIAIVVGLALASGVIAAMVMRVSSSTSQATSARAQSRPLSRPSLVEARQPGSPTVAEPVYGYDIVRVYPHDVEAFTQGLVYLDGFFYESTGLNGRSSLRKVQPETGAIVQRVDVARRYFAEGLAHWNGRLVQLTWDTHVGFVYDLASFRRLRTFPYSGEGWGLTQDGRRLVMSDGSAALRFLDPDTFAETGRLSVHDSAGPVTNLNELESVRGEIFANIWLTDRIARIAPDTGRVTGWIDLQGLRPSQDSTGNDVLNGIAYDPAGDRLFVTGKLWPQVYEIRLRPAQ